MLRTYYKNMVWLYKLSNEINLLLNKKLTKSKNKVYSFKELFYVFLFKTLLYYAKETQ